MIEIKKSNPIEKPGGPLSPEQRAIGQNLHRYYESFSVGPMPKRLQVLLNELNQRAETNFAQR